MRNPEEAFTRCPYCGESNRPCSQITSLATAYARDACRKKSLGVPFTSLSTLPPTLPHSALY
jgi:hypothetical protein